ncbi:MAG: GNAT family N-acetyltransferase [bacterium]|nr:GNAT family N-acetyltransferase [bacterium]
MKIIDLSNEYESLYCKCLEDWSDEIKEGEAHKKTWYNAMQENGLRVKLALDDEGSVGGMIQYLPAEHSFISGSGLYLVYCIWVHGHPEGRGSFQKKGMGKALLKAAEDDVISLGGKGLAAWGLSLPFWMKASWFKKQGYKKADKSGIQVLLWKSFSNDAVPPALIKQKKKPGSTPGCVTVTAFLNGWCPAQNMSYERAKQAVAELNKTYDNKIIFQEINTLNRETFLEWGIVDGLFIDGKTVRTGPPPTYETIKKKVEKRVKKI